MSEAEALVYVALVGAVVAPVVTAFAARRGTRRDIVESIGDPNGRGTVVDMLTELIEGQMQITRRVAHLERTQIDHELRLRRIEKRRVTDEDAV